MTLSSSSTAVLTVLASTVFLQLQTTETTLEGELRNRSSEGLAFVWGQGDPALKIRYFDGRTESRKLECCEQATFNVICRDRIVILEDVTNSTSHLLGEQIVVMDLVGHVLFRSSYTVLSSAVAVHPSNHSLVFVGSYVSNDGVPSRPSVYVADLDGRRPLELVSGSLLGENFGAKSPNSASVSWSHDGSMLLISAGERIYAFNSSTRQLVDVAQGRDATWSPIGESILFTSGTDGAILLDYPKGTRRIILPRHTLLARPTWSPDGRYVLFPERHVGISPCFSYGRLLVYKISDGAMTTIDCFGIAGAPAQWIQLAARN